MIIIVPPEGRACLPQEILTIARSDKRGLLLEVISGEGNPYALLLRNSRTNAHLEAVHKCYAVSEGIACKHLRSAIYFAEKWLNRKLPRKVEIEIRWLNNNEKIAAEDLTPLFLNREGIFKTIKRRE